MYTSRMSRNVPFEGFVIKKIQILDASFVVTLFSRSHGLVKMTAKGIKNITSKRASHLQTGNKIRWFASKHSSNHWYLGTTTLVSGISSIKSDPVKTQSLYHVLQMLDTLLPEEQQEKYVFDAFTQYLVKLNLDDIDIFRLTLGFGSALIGHLGFGSEDIADYQGLRKKMQEITGKDIDFQMN